MQVTGRQIRRRKQITRREVDRQRFETAAHDTAQKLVRPQDIVCQHRKNKGEDTHRAVQARCVSSQRPRRGRQKGPGKTLLGRQHTAAQRKEQRANARSAHHAFSAATHRWPTARTHSGHATARRLHAIEPCSTVAQKPAGRRGSRSMAAAADLRVSRGAEKSGQRGSE